MSLHGLPLVRPGQSVGLLGGSFDPPHAGHVHITHAALRCFGLDHVWWLVSPGNPLKSNAPAPLQERLAAACKAMQHPRVTVTSLEETLGTRYTAQTLAAMQKIAPGVRFVWIMGADNLAQFHKWDSWKSILNRVPVGVLARPGQGVQSRLSPAARMFAQAQVRPGASHGLAQRQAPAWSFANIPLNALSSSAIRARGEW